MKNSNEKVSGPPRFPHAIIITAKKVPATNSRPSAIGSSCSSCTSMNRGAPNSGAGSICITLRLRAEGTSGRLVMSTPTAALEAPPSPADSYTSNMISTRPMATLRPLVT